MAKDIKERPINLSDRVSVVALAHKDSTLIEGKEYKMQSDLAKRMVAEKKVIYKKDKE